MSDCTHFEGQLHDWVDRELDREPAAAVARHVEQCVRCAEIARSIQNLKSLVRAKAGAVPVPERLGSRVREALALEALRADRAKIIRFPARHLRWVAAAVLLVVAIPLGIQLLSPGDLHAQVTEKALDSHLRSLGELELPRFNCMSCDEVEAGLSRELGVTVDLPEFCAVRTCIKGYSVVDFDGLEVGKVFYTLDGEPFSLFVVPTTMRGGESLCCCKSGKKLHVYCTNEGSYCFTFVTTLEGEPFRGGLLEPALRRSIQIHHEEPAEATEPPGG